jgi:hypothetical protein
MSKATNKVTNLFRNTYVVIGDNGPDEDLQRAMFQMGFRWGGDKNRKIDRLAQNYILVDENFEMWFTSEKGITDPNHYSCNEPCVEVPRSSVIKASEKVRKIKRKESKEQKKRAARRKWVNNSTINNGRKPVADDELVTIRRKDGEIRSGFAGSFDWGVYGYDQDIESYKVLKRNKHHPVPQERTVTLEKMLTDVAWDLGKGVAIPVHDMEYSGNVIKAPGEYTLAPMAEIKGEAVPDTNPKRQYGVASVPLNMWSPLASAYGSLGLYNGALKYGKANFANTPVEASIYIAAAFRHLSAWACGEEYDPADGVPNLGGVLANIAILLEARAAGTLIDDRLKMAGYLKEIEKLKEIVKHLNKLHEGKNPKHYTLEEK